MPTGYQIKDQSKPYYLTLQVVEWVDIFSRKVYRDILVDSLNFCISQKGLLVYAYVVMSNHAHVIVQSERNELSSTIRDFKSYTSKQMLQFIDSGKESRDKWMLNIFKQSAIMHKRNSNFQVWTHENHAIEIVNYPFLESKLDYIHANPVRAGIVNRAEEYVYSSAKNYSGEEGLVNITTITRQWKTIN